VRWLGPAALVILLLVSPQALWAAGQRAPSLVAPVSLDGLVGSLLQQGRGAEAAAVLAPLLRDAPENPQILFLSGLVAMARGDTQAAIKTFRLILIDHPDAERVRLELARAFFVAKDYGNASRQFQFARAGHPPAAVLANIDRYLFEIRQAKSLSYSFDISAAPDTNLNGGSASREVTLYGLPFDLSDDARRRSSVGMNLSGAVEWAPRLGPSKRLRLGASLQRREYSGTTFDDMTAAVYAGPRVVTPHWDLSLIATGSRRWYGAQAYDTALGGRVTATYYPSPQLGLTTDIAAQSVDYDTATYLTGSLVSVGETALYALTLSSGVIARSGISRQAAGSDAYSNTGGYLALGYFRDFRRGFSGYVEASASMVRYDAAVAAFGARRADTTWSATINLLNRHIVLSRFTPRVSYTYVRQSSTIPLYSFDRNRVELGLTTTF
jgi:tetratricopeptide (TPR) repeat protein